MFSTNELFQQFRKDLEARGVHIRWGWSAKRDRKAKYDDIAMALFYGNGFQPAILCAIVINYGPRDGFGLFVDGSANMADDLDAIVGPNAPAKAA